ncbi:hypothetical protein BDY19DRAFT_998461 [Irpex rosettiformis]|uniref:Uncharacterized protein n=1 Tax=Irpex rosettiformis TaxID=378272 RepID=A0ACB8TNL6_9APHY|nr:hypothetical protein BDY19DRAFT_998461 [Irpex rosettiformis]
MADEAATVRDLIIILETYFSPAFSAHQAIYVLATIYSFYVLLRLHWNQVREPRQPRFTAWRKITLPLLRDAYEGPDPQQGNPDAHAELLGIQNQVLPLYHDLEEIIVFLGLNIDDVQAKNPFLQQPKLILVTTRLNCRFCEANSQRRSLRLDRDKLHPVHVLQSSLEVVEAILIIAECSQCGATYYPDKIIHRPTAHAPRRVQILESHPAYLCISKSGIWVERSIALMQEKAMHRFTAGWSNFANFVTDLSKKKMTKHQAKKLFIEHFSRRLLVAHGKVELFSCRPHPSVKDLTEAVVNIIGRNGGVLPSSLTHGCKDCTHRKRFREDLLREGFIQEEGPGVAAQVADLPRGPDAAQLPEAFAEDVLLHLPAQRPPQAVPNEEDRAADEELDEEAQFVQMAVMDGKTIGHRICALSDCTNPLVNYKNGRFCKDHLPLEEVCGIIPCGRPVRNGAKTCDLPAHRDWEVSWVARFKRLSFPGVRRVIRRQQGGFGTHALADGPRAQGPVLHVELPSLGETSGNDVVHTFRARSVYCLQTIQWSCGMPIGWGKCYKSESQPQVLAIMNDIWETAPTRRPAFLVYDDACDLLRHIVTQTPDSPWLTDSRLIVDAWHYIGHRSVDALCRQHCNPAPADGSQPDLVQMKKDRDGNSHLTRAFNTETAEQLNSWLTGYEAQLRQMSDISYDFFVHVLMMIFAETIEEQIESKRRRMEDLSDEEE